MVLNMIDVYDKNGNAKRIVDYASIEQIQCQPADGWVIDMDHSIRLNNFMLLNIIAHKTNGSIPSGNNLVCTIPNANHFTASTAFCGIGSERYSMQDIGNVFIGLSSGQYGVFVSDKNNNGFTYVSIFWLVFYNMQ